MKTRITILFFITLFLTSCTEDEIDKSDPELIGSWRLIEILQDPGDGSGMFETVNSNKSIVFSLEGTFTSNGDLCRSSVDTDSPSSGRYDKDLKLIKVNGCEEFGLRTTYSIEDDNLIISGFACIEGCAEKYRRIE